MTGLLVSLHFLVKLWGRLLWEVLKNTSGTTEPLVTASMVS